MSATATPAIRAAARLRFPDKRRIHCTATRTSAIQKEQKSQAQNCDVCDSRDFALGTNGQRHRIGLWRDSCSRQKTQKKSPQAISHDPEAGWNGTDGTNGTNGNSHCSITATDTPPAAAAQPPQRVALALNRAYSIPFTHCPYPRPLSTPFPCPWSAKMPNRFEREFESNTGNGSAFPVAADQRAGKAHDQLLTAGAMIRAEGQRFDGQGESMARRRYQKGRVILRGKANPFGWDAGERT
jgi:hypothetical protein